MKILQTPASNRLALISLAIVLLIVTKTVHIIDWHYADGYWDLDRVVGLVLFLGVVHHYIEPLKLGSWLWLLGLLASFVLLDAITSQLGLARIVQLFILTALVEEILLRGVLFEGLLKKLSPRTALLLTTVLFTMVHTKAYSDPWYALALLITGGLLGGIYLHYRQQSLQKAMLWATSVHMVIILIGVNLAIVQ
ncbi:CPBP family intramembrane glutamic endopeptidase [Thiosulfativibrio zosterae]|uniref:CAAX prenyl protease 2/Lysostaphin resistance protein A-like domain-containing protein n=1 Tax=Thiosulfativibrio zosterae TaxID=2675053 RepID=A0A6F8PMM5_9GAMM|nr:CPBP family intramembrane glutamic endopeptidase [Thiosulfativibrio zosterae]BBP43250.1 hypothetical protein THMIRHAT_09960 [Thiosulfativibrio zosterae]